MVAALADTRSRWTRPAAYLAPAPKPAEPRPAPRLWYAYATHGGGPCSIYIGGWPTTLRLAMEHQRQFGGHIHFVEVRS